MTTTTVMITDKWPWTPGTKSASLDLGSRRVFRWERTSTTTTTTATITDNHTKNNILTVYKQPTTFNQYHHTKPKNTTKVNSEPVVRGSSPPPMTSLNLGQPLMLGGYRWISSEEENEDYCSIFRHLYSVNSESGVVTGLDGAIQRLVVNGEAWTNIATRCCNRCHHHYNN